MRANQAAIQRRVNTPRVQTQQPPSYGGNTQQQTAQPVSNNGYAPYPQPQTNNMPPPNANYGQSSQLLAQTPTSGKMPQGLNPQQQLQFILNVLGERIAKLENNFATLSTTTSSSSDGSLVSNPVVLQNIISNHPEIKTLKDSITRLQSLPSPQQTTSSSSNVSPDVIAEIQTNVDTLFEQVENNEALSKIQEELQTRTELLATEINQVKDMVLQLQSTVINTLLPAIVSQPLPAPVPFTPAPVSTLESFTEAPLNIIPEDPSVNAAIMEENLENAELPTITEPLTYQES
jgi:hypothetical protein